MNTLVSDGKGVSTLQKPDNIFLENTNLAYAIKERPDIRNIREIFVFNQMINAGMEVYSPKEGDFSFNDYTVEVGGKGKNVSQVSHAGNYLIASNYIEVGNENRVPIWLFGFLY